MLSFFMFYHQPFYHRKEFLKTANSTSKGSTTNALQIALLTKIWYYTGKAGITLK